MSVNDEFVRHRGPITCAAWVPGTTRVVTSGYDGAVARFDLGGGPAELLGYHDHLVNRIVVEPGGRWAASPSSDYTVGLWDLESGKLIRRLRGHSDDVEDFWFVDERAGVSVSRDWRILVWDLETGAISRVLEGHEKDVLSVACLDGVALTSGDDMTLRKWDLESGKLVHTWGPFATETDTCAIDARNRRAVLGDDDGIIHVFDIDSGETVGEIEAHASGIKKVACSPVNGDILSAAYDQRIRIWDARELTHRLELEPKKTKWERSFNWSTDGRRIVAGTFDGTVLVWDAGTGTCTHELGDPGDGTDCLNDVSATRDGRIAVVNDGGQVREGRLTRSESRWTGSQSPISGRMLMNAVTIAPDGSILAGSHDQRLHRFNGGSSEVQLNEGPINCIRVAAAGEWSGTAFVACYSGAVVRIAPDGHRVRFRAHENAVKSLRLHPRVPIGVSGSADGIVAAWSFEGEVLRSYPGHVAIVDDVDISPDGTKLASAGRDFTLKVHRFDDAALLDVIPVGRRSPKALIFWDDDTVIVSNYWGELVRVDLTQGKTRRRAIAENGISGLTRSADGLIAVSYDGAAYLVDPDSLEVIGSLRAMRQRLVPPAWRTQA